MAPKTKFPRDQIMQIAFDIAKVQGLHGITIRKIADRLGSSIAPIYVNFKNVDELKEAVMQKILSVGNQLIEEQNTGSIFMDIGIASLKFAKDYPVLFRDLNMKPNKNIENYDDTIGNRLIDQMKNDPELREFTKEELKAMLLKMRIFQTGLSMMIANGQLSPDMNEDDTINLLKETGEDLIISTHTRKKNT